MTTSELNVMTTLQNEIKELNKKINELNRTIEQHEKGKWYWKFCFSIRKIFK